MPFNQDPTDTQIDPSFMQPFGDEAAQVTVGEQLEAALELENVPVAVGTRLLEGAHPRVEGFNPLDHLLPGEELIASEFGGARSPEEMQAIRDGRERERQARAALADGPLNEFLAITIAVAADPVTYVPLIGASTKGQSLLRAAGRFAIKGALEVGASEVALQAAQRTRTLEESLVAVLAGSAFGGTLGIGLKALQRAKLNRLVKDAIDDATVIGRDNYVAPPTEPGGVGAAEVVRLTPEETKLAPSFGVATAISKLKGLVSPSLELMTSPLAKAREMALRLTDTGLVTEGVLAGRPNPVAVETKIKRAGASVVRLSQILQDGYNAARAAGLKTLSRDEFYREVGIAMRRGDIHVHPQVDAAAKALRNEIVTPFFNEAKAVGLFGEDIVVKTAESYFTRVYNRTKIAARLPQFQDKVTKWLEREQLKAKLKPEDVLSELELRDVASQIADRIMGTPAERVAFINVPVKRGPLKERVFDIPDEDIAEFLESNAQEVLARYVRTLAADIEITREFGKADAGKQIGEEIIEEARRVALDPKLTEKAREKLLERAASDAQLVNALLNKIRGTSDIPADPRMMGLIRVGRAARNINFLTKLGSVMISSISDIGRLVMTEGLTRTMGTLASDFGSGFKGIRMSTREAQMAGTANDIMTGARSRSLFDLGERYSAETKMERGLNDLGHAFGNLILLNHWNTTLKGITSAMVGTRVLQTAKKIATGQKVSNADMRRWAASGLTPTDAVKIAEMGEHWDDQGAIILGNTDAWTDRSAVDAFRNAVLRDVDNTIITPGAGDAPLWTSTEWGKTIFQFKRFASASTNRTLIAGLQTRDMATMNGIMVMVGSGVLSRALLDIVTDGEVRERSGEQWIAEGIDRSGAMAIFFELDSIMEKFTGASVVKGLTGEEPSRFAQRGQLAQLLGPTAGLVEDVARAGLAANRGEFTQSDLHKIRRLAPLQNVFYLRFLFTKMEEAAGEAAGLPKKAPRR